MRIDKIQDLKVADAYLITTNINVSYLSGFSGDSSELLITNKTSYLFTDSRYTLLAKKELTDINIITTSVADRIDKISSVLKENEIKSLGIEKNEVSVNQFEKYKLNFDISEYIDVSNTLLRIRAKKTPEEIENIITAAKGNEYVLNKLIGSIKPGLSELDIKAELLYLIYSQEMESAFSPIVAAGYNSAIPHAIPTNYKLKSGDLLTLDFGCKYKGYCSDITRTFAIGNIDEQLKKIYHIVKEAQEKALKYSKSFNVAEDIDKTARNYINERGYGKYYQHGTGHGVGMMIHELPILNPTSSDIIEDDMVFTIEPGIYIPEVGGARIEDTCVGNNGSVYSFTKDLIYL